MLDPRIAGRIRLVALDVDGVLTDGGLYVGRVADHPVELKRFHVHDGLGVWLLRQAGLVVALISGRAAEATRIRARELHIDEVLEDDTGAGRKLAPFEALLTRQGVTAAECAFVGDDLADLPVMRRVGLPIAVANAVPEVRAAAAFVTETPGGAGAVREVAELLLRAQGAWERVLAQYFAERGDAAARVTGSR